MTLTFGATRLSACALVSALFLLSPLSAQADQSAEAVKLPALELPAASLPK